MRDPAHRLAALHIDFGIAAFDSQRLVDSNRWSLRDLCGACVKSDRTCERHRGYGRNAKENCDWSKKIWFSGHDVALFVLKKFIVQFYFIDREDHHKYKKMKINNHFLVGLALILAGCGSGSSESGSNDISCSNLKIFDYNNIYLCGSSIFPENGFTNPTWTIMTLSNRLSSFLSKKN